MSANTFLPGFEGSEVSKAKLRVVGAGDGLSDSLDLEPRSYELGEELCIVLQGKVSQITHKRDEKNDIVIRVHTLSTDYVAPIDAKVARQAIAAERERLEKLRDERDGQLRINGEEPATEPEPEGVLA